jgi:CPA2 family monovalent cation:H+ antiporter-2
VFGDATSPEVLELVHLERARVLVIASTDVHEARTIIEHARSVRPDLDIIVRTHSDTEAAHLRGLGSKVQPIHGDRELAVQMARYTLRRFGVSAIEAEAIAQGLRDRPRGAASPG